MFLPFLQVLEDQLIRRHMKTVVEMENSGVVFMLSNQRAEDLACMYLLFKRVSDGHRAIADCLSSHLRGQGKALVTQVRAMSRANQGLPQTCP